MSEIICNIRDRGMRWFTTDNPQNWTGTKVTLGDDANGAITIEHDTLIAASETEKAEIVIPTTPQVAASVAYASNKITISLAVGAATKTLGSGENGTLTLTHANSSTDNKVEVVVSNPEAAAASAAYAAKKLTITLAADTGSSDLAANAIELIADAINALEDCPITATASGDGSGRIIQAVAEAGFTSGSTDVNANKASTIVAALNLFGAPVKVATYAGTGATKITSAIAAADFDTAGHLGTPCQEAWIGFQDKDSTSIYYICIAAQNDCYNENWRQFTVADM